jgi:glutamate synthase domain-containing protein 2
VQEAYRSGAIKEFERHSRLGFIDKAEFMRNVEYLRRALGVKRVTLKTGAYGFRELAMAMKWCSEARVDLLTIDGSGGGTGMSPWRMMQEWGVPTFHLQCMAYECAQKLATQGEWVPSLAMAGGFSTEDHIFKVLAMGAPYFNAVCMGRALMIPGFVGNNIEKTLAGKNEFKGWQKLPGTVSSFGSSAEEIFACYSTLKEKYGAKRMEQMPLGALAIYTVVDKLKTGLSQFMAGARSFRLDTIQRSDIVALSDEAARISGLKFVTDAYREEAEEILQGK